MSIIDQHILIESDEIQFTVNCAECTEQYIVTGFEIPRFCVICGAPHEENELDFYD